MAKLAMCSNNISMKIVALSIILDYFCSEIKVVMKHDRLRIRKNTINLIIDTFCQMKKISCRY